MKTFAAALLTAVASARLIDVRTEYLEFVAKFNKEYKKEAEFELRYQQYQKQDEAIRMMKITQKSSKHGHNHLSDWLDSEKSKILGLKNMPRPIKSENVMEWKYGQTLPSSVDWRTQGAVNPVKNQGQCGSCWSFASTAVMESAHYIFSGNLVSLSEQNLVSCSFLQGNLGCNGGWYYYAWNYAAKKALMSEADYPYTSGTTGVSGSCLYNSSQGIVNSTG